jgi:hypothetical protein
MHTYGKAVGAWHNHNAQLHDGQTDDACIITSIEFTAFQVRSKAGTLLHPGCYWNIQEVAEQCACVATWINTATTDGIPPCISSNAGEGGAGALKTLVAWDARRPVYVCEEQAIMSIINR